MTSANVVAGLLALVLTVLVYLRKPKQTLPLPPGPKKWPLIGNLLQLPTSFEWETYAHWSEIYSRFSLSFTR